MGLKKVKIQFHGHIIGTFYEKELQKTNQQEFRREKVIKKKGHNGKVMIVYLIAGFIKKN